MTAAQEENRVRQIVVGACILGVLALMVCGLLVGWRYLPGLWGEWIGMMVGVITTPFFLEASFIFVGMMLVLVINYWRRTREGDELVYLEQLEGPDVPANLPEHAKWALYREQPLAGETPTLLEQAEGALAIGDHEAAAEWIGAMSEAELKQPETLALRLALAKATGRGDLAGKLETELRAIRNGHR